MNKSEARMSKNRKSRKRKSKFKKIIFILILFFAITSTLKKIGALNIGAITITGAENIPRKEILKKAQISKGQYYFSVPNKTRIKGLKSIPTVKDAKISFSPNRTVTIKISKRIPKAQIKGDSNYYIIDDEFKVIEIRSKENDDLMLINGLKNKDYKLGEVLFTKESDQKEFIKRLFKDESLYKKIDSVQLKKTFVKFTTNDEIKVDLGTYTDLDYKFKMLEQILKDIEETGKDVSLIEMEKGKDPIAVSESSDSEKNSKDSNNDVNKK